MSAKVEALCISDKKGEKKRPVEEVTIYSRGIRGDAHAGMGHRQVSLLQSESVSSFGQSHDLSLSPGDFAENVLVSGLDFKKIRLGDQILLGKQVVLEVTQIGKSCHNSGCSISKATGACIMPKEGIFARVVAEGNVRTGDGAVWQPVGLKMVVLTASDRAYRGEYEDLSGPRVCEKVVGYLKERGWRIDYYAEIVPDERAMLERAVDNALRRHPALLFTTGGTGIGPRDVTPEVISPRLERELPGVMEAVRMKYGLDNPGALLSRSVAGAAGTTLVYALPGSVKAVDEYLTVILPTLPHSLRMVRQIDLHQ